MESLTKLTFKHHPLILSSHHSHHYPLRPSFSLISFKTQSSHPSLSFKIHSSSSSSSSNTLYKSSNSNPFQRPNSLFTLLKTPLCIAVAATAIFFSRFGHKPLLAIAAPVVESETTEQTVSDEEREKSLEEHLGSNPDDVQALKSLMEVKIKNKKLQESVEIISRLIELEPDDYEWPLLRAHVYSYMGESELAKSGFEDILAKDPFRVEAYHGLVMAVSQGDESDSKELNEVSKRIQGAMEKCRKEKRKDDERDFKLLIAQVRVIQGNYNEALKVYQELVKEEPRDFRPYLCQGIIYTLLRKKDEAEKQFEKYKRLVPKGHPYAQYFDDNMFATKVFSQMAENGKVKVGSRG